MGHEGRVLKAKGQILTLTAHEAVDCGLARSVAADEKSIGKSLGVTRWTNVIGETGNIHELERWASRYARWLCGGPKPERSAEEMQRALDAAGLTLNKNTVPGEQFSPFYPSGVRLGTPAVTTRGMKEAEMEQIAAFIAEVLEKPGDVALQAQVKDKVRALTAKFPLPY